MSTINIFQISLEIWGVILSVILAVGTNSAIYRSNDILKRVWTMLIVNCMLLSCDILAYIYRGDPSTVGFAMTRISNFGVFFLEGILVWCFTYVIQQIITGQKKVSLKSTPMLIASVCVAIQLIGTIITPFTSFYYYFDDQNYYVRGNFVILSFLLLGAVLAMNIFEVVRNKKNLSAKMWHTFVGMAIIIVFSVFIQFVFYGISLINIAITLIIMIFFILLLVEQREQEFESHVSGMEAIIKELRSRKTEDAS